MAKEIELEAEEEGRKRGRPRKVVEDAIFGDDVDNDEQKRLREESEISMLLEREDATNSTILVSRRLVHTQRYAHLAEIGINDYQREELARQYGGGEYRCRVRRGDGQFGATWYFAVDLSRKPEVTDESRGTATGLDAVRLVETVAEKFASRTPPANDLTPMFTLMSDKSDKMMQMMIMSQQESTKMMIAMMQAMVQNRPSPNDGLAGMSQMILKHSLEQQGTRMDDMIGTIIKLKELANGEDRDEPEDKGGSFVQDIMSAIPAVLRSFSGAQQAQQAPAPQLPVEMVAPSVIAPTAPTRMPVLPVGLDPQAFAMVIMNLLQFASVKSEPIDVHNSYQPMLTDEMYAQIGEFLETNELWFEDICTICPDATPYKVWFSALRDIILEEEDEEEEEDDREEALQELPPPAMALAPNGNGTIEAKVVHAPKGRKK